MKKLLLTICLGLLVLSSSVHAARRNVEAIGLRALKNGRISPVKPARDFTRIAPGVDYARDRLLVRFAPEERVRAPGRATMNNTLESVGGGSIEREYKLVSGLTLVRLPEGITVNEETLRRFNASPRLLYAEPDYIEHAGATIPNDTEFERDAYNYYQWTFYDPYNDYQHIEAPSAWNHGQGSHEIVVAVIDSGVNYNHSDLADNIWVNEAELNGTQGVDDDPPSDPNEPSYIDDFYGYDFVNEDGYPMDDDNHGTLSAGIIGGVGDNAYGIAGLCWDVRIMAVKSLDSNHDGSVSDAVAAIEYATAMGAHVINNSYRLLGNDESLEEAVQATTEANIVFVAAAGNDGRDFDVDDAVYPACFSAGNIISVMATNRYGSCLAGSSHGHTAVDLGAPGDYVYSTRISGFLYADGTSVAAPHVSGVAALLLSMNPSLTYSQVKSIIVSNTEDRSLDCASHGLLQANTAVADEDVSEVISPPVWAVDGSGDVSMWVDARGNLILTGDLNENSACSGTGIDGFKIADASSDEVALFHTDTGDLDIAGDCHEFQENLTPTNSRLTIKAADGTVLAYFNTSGDLYLVGEVFESI